MGRLFVFTLILQLFLLSLALAEVIDPASLDQQRQSLVAALTNGDVDSVRNLLGPDHKVDPNFFDSRGFSPLIIATATLQKEEVVEMLLNVGANVNHVEADGWSPVLFATSNQNFRILDLLLRFNANPLLPTNIGLTAWIKAHELQNTELIAMLEPAVQKSVARTEAYLVAAQQGDAAQVRQHLADGQFANAVNGAGWSALAFAAFGGHLETINVLIDAGVSVNMPENDGWSPLMFAAHQGHYAAVETLLFHGANPLDRSRAGVDAFEISSEGGHGQVAHRLAHESLHLGIHTSNVGNTDTETIMRRVHAGVDPNIANDVGWTPLVIMAQRNEVIAAAEIIQKGATIDYQEKDGWSPLMFAAYEGNIDMVTLLMEAGANPFLTSSQGHTARNIAEQQGRLDIVERIDIIVANRNRDGGDSASSSSSSSSSSTDGAQEASSSSSSSSSTTTTTTTTSTTATSDKAKATSMKGPSTTATSSSSNSAAGNTNSNSRSKLNPTAATNKADDPAQKARSDYTQKAKERALKEKEGAKKEDGSFFKMFGF